ncbi:NAD(P)/FAD-dependent oxidoreductase [Tsukamurella soli]|uniref:FAD-dependent oxidoreductase n=1 Tax=Tsukamurella soli TaxID=644556 RepID=A0ABP8JRV9_9ACTN
MSTERGAEGRAAVVIGAGHAGVTAATALRERGWTGHVVLLGAEDRAPYQRPPLSKGYLSGRESEHDFQLTSTTSLERRGIEYRQGVQAIDIDRERRRVLDSEGGALAYSALILATGARARRLGVPGEELIGVHSLRSADDAVALRARFAAARRIVIVGGGYLGLEVAAAASAHGDVTVLERTSQLLHRSASAPIASRLAAGHRHRGVRILYNAAIAAFEGIDGRIARAVLADGRILQADLVVVAVGAEPDCRLAARAGLAVDRGVVVDDRLRAADPHIRAIGDCARCPNAHAARPILLQSVQNAVDHARYVASDLADGERAPYEALAWFWSRQYDLNLQIAGIADPDDGVVLVDSQEHDKTVAVRVRDGLITAVETLNSPGVHVRARRLLAQGPVALDRAATSRLSA